MKINMYHKTLKNVYSLVMAVFFLLAAADNASAEIRKYFPDSGRLMSIQYSPEEAQTTGILYVSFKNEDYYDNDTPDDPTDDYGRVDSTIKFEPNIYTDSIFKLTYVGDTDIIETAEVYTSYDANFNLEGLVATYTYYPSGNPYMRIPADVNQDKIEFYDEAFYNKDDILEVGRIKKIIEPTGNYYEIKNYWVIDGAQTDAKMDVEYKDSADNVLFYFVFDASGRLKEEVDTTTNKFKYFYYEGTQTTPSSYDMFYIQEDGTWAWLGAVVFWPSTDKWHITYAPRSDYDTSKVFIQTIYDTDGATKLIEAEYKMAEGNTEWLSRKYYRPDGTLEYYDIAGADYETTKKFTRDVYKEDGITIKERGYFQIADDQTWVWLGSDILRDDGTIAFKYTADGDYTSSKKFIYAAFSEDGQTKLYESYYKSNDDGTWGWFWTVNYRADGLTRSSYYEAAPDYEMTGKYSGKIYRDDGISVEKIVYWQAVSGGNKYLGAEYFRADGTKEKEEILDADYDINGLFTIRNYGLDGTTIISDERYGIESGQWAWLETLIYKNGTLEVYLKYMPASLSSTTSGIYMFRYAKDSTSSNFSGGCYLLYDGITAVSFNDQEGNKILEFTYQENPDGSIISTTVKVSATGAEETLYNLNDAADIVAGYAGIIEAISDLNDFAMRVIDGASKDADNNTLIDENDISYLTYITNAFNANKGYLSQEVIDKYNNFSMENLSALIEDTIKEIKNQEMRNLAVNDAINRDFYIVDDIENYCPGVNPENFAVLSGTVLGPDGLVSKVSLNIRSNYLNNTGLGEGTGEVNAALSSGYSAVRDTFDMKTAQFSADYYFINGRIERIVFNDENAWPKGEVLFIDENNDGNTDKETWNMLPNLTDTSSTIIIYSPDGKVVSAEHTYYNNADPTPYAYVYKFTVTQSSIEIDRADPEDGKVTVPMDKIDYEYIYNPGGQDTSTEKYTTGHWQLIDGNITKFYYLKEYYDNEGNIRQTDSSVNTITLNDDTQAIQYVEDWAPFYDQYTAYTYDCQYTTTTTNHVTGSSSTSLQKTHIELQKDADGRLMLWHFNYANDPNAPSTDGVNYKFNYSEDGRLSSVLVVTINTTMGVTNTTRLEQVVSYGDDSFIETIKNSSSCEYIANGANMFYISNYEMAYNTASYKMGSYKTWYTCYNKSTMCFDNINECFYSYDSDGRPISSQTFYYRLAYSASKGTYTLYGTGGMVNGRLCTITQAGSDYVQFSVTEGNVVQSFRVNYAYNEDGQFEETITDLSNNVSRLFNIGDDRDSVYNMVMIYDTWKNFSTQMGDTSLPLMSAPEIGAGLPEGVSLTPEMAVQTPPSNKSIE